MAKYTCSICGSQVHEELRPLHEEAERWLVDRIKRQHPEWVSADGACSPCIEAYKAKRDAARD
ncbi:MAG: hypothetical protein ACREJ4_04950 [Candidatus Methylomirabilaceae bacterium]